MGLTVSRKTAKNLAVRRKNERILTVNAKKILPQNNTIVYAHIICASRNA